AGFYAILGDDFAIAGEVLGVNLKVLHVYKTYLPEDFTGVPRVIHALSSGMAEHGVQSHVLALGDNVPPAPLKIDGHTIHIAKRDLNIASAGLSLSAFGLFKQLSSDADIVHYHFPWPFADLLHLYARPRGRTIVTY